MSLLVNLGTEPEGLEASCWREGFLTVGEYHFSNIDFCELVRYFLTNTDLNPDDPRVKLVREIAGTTEEPGWNHARGWGQQPPKKLVLGKEANYVGPLPPRKAPGG